MPDLEVDEMIILIMTIFPLAASMITVIKNRTVAKWIPVFISLFFTFLFTNLEAVVAPTECNFLEHFFSMMIGVSMAFAAIIEIYNTFKKEKYAKLRRLRQLRSGGMK